MGSKVLVRIGATLLILLALAFLCGGITRTIYQQGGPLWLNPFADTMWGISMCCLAGAGICALLNRSSRLHRQGWSKFIGILELTGGVAGLTLGMVIALRGVLELVSFMR